MVKRESYLKILRDVREINLIKVVTGVRRCGKSTLLSQFRQELAESSAGNIIYYNLEEKENEQFTQDPDSLYDRIISRLKPDTTNYIFVDEVQMVPEFERMLDSLYVKPNTDIYVTGSNAYMLSSDIATILTGRYIEIRMQPLVFSEFVQFFGGNTETNQLFQQYLRTGGFPEAVNMLAANAGAEVPVYLQSVYNTILEKDVKKRKAINSMDDFRRIYQYCLDNIGSLTSANNIANAMNSAHRSIDRKTVASYLQSMVDCFLLYQAERYDIRGKNILRTGEKYYTVDLGLADTLLGRPTMANLGHRLENVVFLELQKRYGKVWVGKNQDKEIDFVVKNTNGEHEYFQVSLSIMDKNTRIREFSAIKNTGDFYRRTILTMDPLETNESGISCRNLVSWLLEK